MRRSWESTKIYFAVYVFGILIIGLQAWSENEIDGSDFDSHPFNHKSPASELPHEVDILKLINITAKDPGVSIVQGPIKNFPAYKFRLPYGNVPVANSSAVTSAMSRPSGFTVIFLFRQQKNNLGTLISINSPGRLTPWFQINSNLRTGVLTLKYKMNASSKLHQVDWPLPGHHRKTPLAGK
ncbi:uncharacterized protein LOC108736684 [Agrilus planipennis]|uniref:Uncharacterized protein LOC108736684 n=1 Tax=Agrilus planipennis TaxID=224129 RepID=A0A7F5R756_AGRPL|nr:uncharacterized protein LOC108736684 [Agrilus planipennis]